MPSRCQSKIKQKYAKWAAKATDTQLKKATKGAGFKKHRPHSSKQWKWYRREVMREAQKRGIPIP